MEIILFIFFIFIVIAYAGKSSKSADHDRRDYNESFNSDFNATTNFINLQYTEDNNSFDSHTNHCSSQDCYDGCEDNNCDCGDGGSCD
jgi:hypothetical protein